jgi:hypothetical protein
MIAEKSGFQFERFSVRKSIVELEEGDFPEEANMRIELSPKGVLNRGAGAFLLNLNVEVKSPQQGIYILVDCNGEFSYSNLEE